MKSAQTGPQSGTAAAGAAERLFIQAPQSGR